MSSDAGHVQLADVHMCALPSWWRALQVCAHDTCAEPTAPNHTCAVRSHVAVAHMPQLATCQWHLTKRAQVQ